jgi:hypothetical protein
MGHSAAGGAQPQPLEAPASTAVTTRDRARLDETKLAAFGDCIWAIPDPVIRDH